MCKPHRLVTALEIRMTLKRILGVALFLIALISQPISAQSDRGTIAGVVKDTSSAVVPGVHVSVTNIGTNDVHTVVTDSAGLYRVPNLPIGSYTVQFSDAGFKTLKRTGITLLIGQVVAIDASLSAGGATELVNVTSEAPQLQTENTAVGTNLDAQAVSELPENVQGSRNLSNFLFNYVPGVEGSDYSSHIDGSVAFTKEVLIDGTSAISQIGGYISESQPPQEAVQEYEADTSGIAPDAGRSGGGVFRYELKSGTNQIHGSLFGFLHSTALDAEGAANKLNAITNPANAAAYLRKSDTLSDWGGGFGGPIIKNKLFYFIAFERYQQSDLALGSNSRTVPTDAMLGLNADGSTAAFADLSPQLTKSNIIGTDPCGNTVYQGAVFNPTVTTAGGRYCVFVNNQIPTSLITSSPTRQILQLFHQSYQPEATGPVNDAGPAYNPDPFFHNTQSSIKIDYNISSRQHLNGSYYYDDYPRINADQGGAWSAILPNGGPLANSYFHNTTAPGARLSYSYTFTPNVVNTVYGTYNSFHNPSAAVSQSGNWDSKLGLLNGAGNFPLINFSSGFFGNGANYQNGWNFSPLGSQFNDYYSGNTFVYSDQLIYNHGKHSLKFGAEFRALQFNSHPDVGTFEGGNPLIFDPTSTAPDWFFYGAGFNNLGNAFASFLLGDVFRATNTTPDPEYGRRKAFSVYASDTIRMSQRLTVNLSLRWDYNNPYKEKYGHWSSFVTGAANPVTGEQGEYQYLSNGSQSFETRQDWYNYAPHIGAAYKLTDKTVVRANFAVFFTPLNLNTYGGIPYQTNGNPGFYQQSTESNFNWGSGYKPTLSELKTPDYTQFGPVSIDPRALRPGNTQQYNIGFQRELDHATTFEANWIQSHSYHLQSGIFLNNQPTVANLQNYLINGTFPASYNGFFNGVGPAYAGITPFPQVAAGFGPLYSVGTPLGNGDYKSVQLSVTRRVARGLSAQGSYNWSRAHGDVDSDFEELYYAGSLQNIYDLQNERKDILDFDQTHIVKGYIIYNLPFGRGGRFLANSSRLLDAVVGGWSTDLNFHYNSGTPVQLHSSNAYPGFQSVYINIAPGCNLTTGNKGIGQAFINKSCFSNPNAAVGALGNGQNFQAGIRNPGYSDEDLAAHKGFSVGPENRYTLTLRMEFYNLFNRSHLGGPDTNFGDPVNFGKIIGYVGGPGRVGQFGARLTF
jgi:Carboxypeptidase regulatory-like domain/TonB dependent receptor